MAVIGRWDAPFSTSENAYAAHRFPLASQKNAFPRRVFWRF
jgi:hypothetical protein